MGSRQRTVDIGAARGRELARRGGQEIRDARQDRGLSLKAVSRSVGLSESQVSRIERGLIEHVSVLDLARLHAVVGLSLSLKSYPAGQPIRDGAHVELLSDLRTQLHKSLRWAAEVPLPMTGDQRSWDALITGQGWRFGVEAETAPRDAQAVARRIQLKQRDGGTQGVLLVLRRTVQSRRFLAEASGHLRELFPIDGRRALELLGAGVSPGGNAIVVMPRRGLEARHLGRLATPARNRSTSMPPASQPLDFLPHRQ